MARWLAGAGAFVVSLDSTVNIAFPAMAATFAVPPERIRWVVICYVFTYALMSFAGGALGDRLGHGRVFRSGMALSTVAYVLAAAAPAFGWFLAARVVQGFAGGLVYGTAPGLVTLGVSPAARGRALGFLNAAVGAGLAVGPVVAGFLVDGFGWRSVFHLRVPLALAVLALPRRGGPDSRRGAAPRLVAARDVLRAPVLVAGALAFAANVGIFAIWLLAPFYLVQQRGLPARAGGLLFMLTPLGTTIAAPLAGRLGDRLGSRPPVLVGLVLEAAGLAAMSRAGATTPVAAIGVALLAAGFGLGLFQVPNMVEVMAAFPAAQQGAAGGFAFLSRTLGTVCGVAAMAQVFAVRRAVVGAGAAFGDAFIVGAAVVLLATLAAARYTRRSWTS